MNQALEQYCEAEALAGYGIFGARSTVYGEAWRCGLNLKVPSTLELSHAALAGWSDVAPGDSKMSLPWIFACDMSWWRRQQDVAMSVRASSCMLTSYDTCVRPSVAVDLCDLNAIVPPTSTKEAYLKVALLLSPSYLGVGTTKEVKGGLHHCWRVQRTSFHCSTPSEASC